MLLIAELVMILVLIAVLFTLLIEERRIKSSRASRGSIKEYWNGRERRQAMRVNTFLTVRYSVEKKYHIKSNWYMKDISASGMRLLVNEKLKEEALLLLEFDLPKSERGISAEGKVIWCNGEFADRDEIGRRVFQTGIQFVNMRLNDKEVLTAYIMKYSEDA